MRMMTTFLEPSKSGRTCKIRVQSSCQIDNIADLDEAVSNLPPTAPPALNSGAAAEDFGDNAPFDWDLAVELFP